MQPLDGRAVGTAEQVPKAKRHDHLPGEKGYFNAAALQAGTGPLWVCEGAFDALALLAAGVPRVIAIFGVHGWCWAWARAFPRAGLRLGCGCRRATAVAGARAAGRTPGKQVAVLPPHAYGGWKDVSEAWAAGVLCLDGGAADVESTRDAAYHRRAGRPGRSALRSWLWTGVSHLRRPSAARGRATRRQKLMERPAVRESVALRAEGSHWTGSPGWARVRHQRTPMLDLKRSWIQTTNCEKSWAPSVEDGSRTWRINSLRSFANPNGGKRRLSSTSVRTGPWEPCRMGTRVTRSKRFSVPSSRVTQHEERQQFLRDLEHIRVTFFAVAKRPEETAAVRQRSAALLYALQHKYGTPSAKPESR